MLNLKNKIRQNLPDPIINILKTVKRSSTKYRATRPVVQAYINDENIESYIGISNFFSLLLPHIKTDAKAYLVFYDSNGKVILKYNRKVPHGDALSIGVKELFHKKNIYSKFGIVTLELVPSYPRWSEYKKLGNTSSHFYIFYQDQLGSVGQVHPSSILEKKQIDYANFTSNQLIVTKNLEKIVLMQINPSESDCDITHSLVDPNDDYLPLLSQKSLCPARSVRMITFNLISKDVPEVLGLTVSPIPSSNSKPVLFRYYTNKQFSLSHS